MDSSSGIVGVTGDCCSSSLSLLVDVVVDSSIGDTDWCLFALVCRVVTAFGDLCLRGDDDDDDGHFLFLLPAGLPLLACFLAGVD